MNVLHFAFDGDPTNMYLPHNVKRNSVTYTATHDNQTSVGWFSGISDEERQHVRHYLGHRADDIAWDLLRLAWASVSNTAIAPMQDVLRMGDEARMNTPATATGNWAWRMLPSQLDPLLADGMRDITKAYGRTVDAEPSTSKNPWDYTDPGSGIEATRTW
jgi:4-alpha-glucanotransferase